MLLLLAAALPGLFWEGAPDTAATLREAGIREIVVTAPRLESWKNVAGISVKTGDTQGEHYTKVRVPTPDRGPVYLRHTIQGNEVRVALKQLGSDTRAEVRNGQVALRDAFATAGLALVELKVDDNEA